MTNTITKQVTNDWTVNRFPYAEFTMQFSQGDYDYRLLFFYSADSGTPRAGLSRRLNKMGFPVNDNRLPDYEHYKSGEWDEALALVKIGLAHINKQLPKA